MMIDVVCNNSMHKIADQVEASINVPLLHIVDVTAEKIMGSEKVGLLGTRFTMKELFYRRRSST